MPSPSLGRSPKSKEFEDQNLIAAPRQFPLQFRFMSKLTRFSGLVALGFALCFSSSSRAAEAHRKTAIVVDKQTHHLHVCDYVDGEYKILKTYKATLGQVKGDKEDEGDLKTPEGIYTFKALLRPPAIAKKFGSMAFYMNYPNTFDQLAGHSGSNIMLHATDDPKRLERNYDSLGCVVVHEDEIREIQPHIRLGLTPILVFENLPEGGPARDEFMKPGGVTPEAQKLKTFFASWIQAWETKDLETYIGHYHSDFVSGGMKKSQWRTYKQNLNKNYASISIGPEDVLYYRHPKYSMITFTQNYHSKLRSGAWGHVSRGTKILYIAEEDGQPKVIAETYTNLMW